jgi:superfamily II DNA or RNA helicase
MINYDYIYKNLSELKLIYDEDKMISKSIFKIEQFKFFPTEIIILICENIKLVINFINFYKNKMEKLIEIKKIKYKELENFDYKILFASIKEKYKKFNDIIINWLKETDFFKDLFKDKNIINFEFRINQKEAIEKLELYGLQTGIHCQATGCGKTNIILKYIEYCKKFQNPKIILFTERKSIFIDLFDCHSNKINNYIINNFHNNGICDLTDFQFINRITNKSKDYDSLLIDSNLPTLLIINRAFLTSKILYHKFNKNNISLVLHDECHNSPSIQCNKFLKYCYDKEIPIVGFSATPLRTGKNEISKLLEIYGNNNKLNLLTDYNMIYAIEKDLILCPEFYWYYINENENEKEKHEYRIVLELLNELVIKTPYKKIIAWCGTINNTVLWKNIFEREYKKYKNLENFTFGLDTSNKQYENFYENFKNKLDQSILFCAEKHREGSDIINLDMCIFLDNVKKRGSIPFIQSIGRVLRKDKNNKKEKGIIIDGIIKTEYYERDIIDKIINYYSALQNISIENENENENDEIKNIKLNELIKKIEYDKINNKIILNINDLQLKINCKKLDFTDIIKNINNIIQDKIKFERELFLKKEFDELKQLIKNKFTLDTEYKNYAKNNNLEINPEIKYKTFGWINYYDFLNIDMSHFPDNKYDLYLLCKKYNITPLNYMDKAKQFNLPLMIYDLYGSNIDTIFTDINII